MHHILTNNIDSTPVVMNWSYLERWKSTASSTAIVA